MNIKKSKNLNKIEKKKISFISLISVKINTKKM